MPVHPLGILFGRVNRLTGFYSFVVLPGRSVFGIGAMHRQLVVVEDVGLAGAFLGVNPD
jgi:hypothetical protein